jgi:hypothetical protein
LVAKIFSRRLRRFKKSLNIFNEREWYKKKLKENLENIFSGKPKYLFSNKCARSCCINSGWPYPDALLEKDISKEELKKYIPTNFSCGLGSNLNGGCLCTTKEDLEYLSKRGGNMPY